MKLRNVLTDPLIHFLLFGLLLFIFSELFLNTNSNDDDSLNIVVDKERQTQLAALFKGSRNRAPNAKEMTALIDSYVMEEIYYREALKLNLDKNDIVIRRRLGQKLEYLQEDVSSLLDPSAEELSAWFQENQQEFLLASRYWFSQILLNPDDLSQANSILDQLNSGEISVTEINQSVLLETNNVALSERDISGRFGDEFAEGLVDLQEEGVWQGPISSVFGQHLVRLDRRKVGRVPQIPEVEEKVLQEYRSVQRKRQQEKFKRQLKEQYRIEVE